jgi:starvation-inducible DNA-binding protein
MSKKEMKQEATVVDMAVTPAKREQVAEALSRFLATTFTLYMETLNFHWNVTGEHFMTLHTLFEEQYEELRLASDEIAERVRALGVVCPGTFREFGKLSAISEPESLPKSEMNMVEQLLKHHELASKEANAVLEIAEKASDDVSVDMMVGRMKVHDKTAWMLRSILG